MEIGRRRWSEALEAAERGMAIDPEDTVCTNLRAMALVQLGRKAEAEQVLGSALAERPGERLDARQPGLGPAAPRRPCESARALPRGTADRARPRMGPPGIVESLKARYLVYRLMLRFFLWMGRQSSVAQWVVLLGFVFGRKILADLARSHPVLGPIILPLLALSFAFLVLTWIASPLFNLLLRLNRFGRLALSRDQRIASSWIGAASWRRPSRSRPTWSIPASWRSSA